MIRVTIVDDQPDIRENLSTLLSCTPGFKCVSHYGSAEAALKGIPHDKPQVVLMDINLGGGMTGIECVRKLKIAAPEAQCLMLTVYDQAERVFEALKAGATGYLLKRTPHAELLEGIRDTVNGGSAVDPQIARKVIQFFHAKPPPKQPRNTEPTETLSDREQQVLDALAQGYLYKEIADHLAISIDTVRKHITNIYRKLHVRSRFEAIRILDS